jgi:3-oxoacyl-[acyl-carrier-protein] synthase-1
MASVNILDYEILSSQGDLAKTLQKIKSQTTKISTKGEIPFYSFEKPIEQNQKSIYDALKTLVAKIVSRMDNNKRKSTAILLGTSIIDWNLVDAINSCAYEYKKTPYNSQKTSIDTYAQNLSKEFGLNSFTMTINTACTSSANALLEASNLINSGVVESVIVIGLEVYSPLMSDGFYKMELISSTHAKPFDKKRDGLVLGEALGAMLVSKDSSKWSLLGGFSNCNSATITSVSSSGDECVEVMQEALDRVDLTSTDITAIKAHATGSTSNDEAEINAISRVFDSDVDFTALKPYIGHTIGASGVVEIALFMACIDDGFIPKTLFCSESILETYEPLKEHKKCNSGTFMCNYFGFGGNNISLILEKKT